MAGRRFQGDHARCRDRADGSCAVAMVRRLSEERVRELAEDIWTASSGRVVPAHPIPDARPRRGSQVAAETRAFLAEQGVDLESSRPSLVETTSVVIRGG